MIWFSAVFLTNRAGSLSLKPFEIYAQNFDVRQKSCVQAVYGGPGI